MKIQLLNRQMTHVDREWHGYLSQWLWRRNERGDVVRVIPGASGPILMACEVLRSPGATIMHLDGDQLNNRTDNLRVLTLVPPIDRQARVFSSQYRGVSWKPCGDRQWVAQIRRHGQAYHIGYFNDEIDAAKAYDRTAKELLGDAAKLNFR